MKRFILLIITSLIYDCSFAQWTVSGSNIYNSNSGNVGVGISSPSDKLSVNGNVSVPIQNSFGFGQSDRFTYDSKSIGNYSLGWYNDSQNTGAPTSFLSSYGGIKFFTAASVKMIISASGNIGINTINPGQKLEVAGSIYQNAENSAFGIDSPGDPVRLGFIKKSGNGPVIAAGSGSPIIFSQSNQTSIFTNIAGATFTESMRIDAGGNVGIGTASPDARLSVRGSIHTQEVKVDLAGSVAPDYVFEQNYNLLPLAELEQYLKLNKHLPEVPAAQVMEADGLNLKEMNLLLLKKIEELTLYMIELKKENEEIKKQLNGTR